MTTSIIDRALAHATAPVLMFDAPLEGDDAGVLDLRATDLPMSDVMVRNDVRRRWRSALRLVVRIDADPSPRVRALLLELARREVRLTADEVDRFDDTHTVLVKIAAAAPPASLVPFFPIRVRAAAAPLAPGGLAMTSARGTTSRAPVKAVGESHARRR